MASEGKEGARVVRRKKKARKYRGGGEYQRLLQVTLLLLATYTSAFLRCVWAPLAPFVTHSAGLTDGQAEQLVVCFAAAFAAAQVEKPPSLSFFLSLPQLDFFSCP